MKALHLHPALAWAVAIILLLLLGIRTGLIETIREVNRFDAEDRR